MADPRAQVDVRHVILPWARPEAAHDSGDESKPEQLAAHERELRVSADRLIIRKPARRSDAPTAETAAHGSLLPPLFPHGLPFKPHPSIPEADRDALEPAALISAAVALDVLATGLRPLAVDSELLAALTRTMLVVGEAGGLDTHTVGRLLGHAKSQIGNSRASLSQQLSQVMASVPLPVDGSTEPTETTAVGAALASTPRAVGRSLRRLVRGAESVIREALLRLYAEEPIDYKQA